jgi:hypothetical protein
MLFRGDSYLLVLYPRNHSLRFRVRIRGCNRCIFQVVSASSLYSWCSSILPMRSLILLQSPGSLSCVVNEWGWSTNGALSRWATCASTGVNTFIWQSPANPSNFPFQLRLEVHALMWKSDSIDNNKCTRDNQHDCNDQHSCNDHHISISTD